jgi:hypothetical protein
LLYWLALAYYRFHGREINEQRTGESDMKTYICVITWNGCEIGFGEGESASYAKSEAMASVDSIYKVARSEWSISARVESI